MQLVNTSGRKTNTVHYNNYLSGQISWKANEATWEMLPKIFLGTLVAHLFLGSNEMISLVCYLVSTVPSNLGVTE